ncbi:MAG: 50S ribosomal protein L6 [bacterium]|nr:50S ribosomal protein L6 [bacterium]
MSKVGKKPISIPDGVTVTVHEKTLEVKGKEGTITLPILDFTTIAVKEKELVITGAGNAVQARSNWGTMRSLAQNAITGVHTGYTKELEIRGVGFRAIMEGATLVLSIGFSHPVKFQQPAGIKIIIEKSFIKISGADKNAVGQAAAHIRALKKPEPYKGKGIRYRDEVVIQKAGKKVAGATGTAAAK